MKNIRFFSHVLLLLTVFVTLPGKAQVTQHQTNPSFADFVFIENKGQVMDVSENPRPEVLFMYSNGDNAMYFERNRVVCVFARRDKIDVSGYVDQQRAYDSLYRHHGMTMQRIDIEFEGALSNGRMIPGERGSTVFNYFLNQRENIQNVHSFNSLTYENIYPGIDIVFRAAAGGIKYDVVLHPGADIHQVKIRYNGAQSVKANGSALTIETGMFTFTESLPEAYFDFDRNQPAEVNYVVNGDVIGFSSTYDQQKTLTIDPVLTWATYYETTTFAGNMDYDHNVADTAGNLYISGYCGNSANTYPTVNPGGSAYVQAYTSNDLFIVKFDDSRNPVWATYFGGSNSAMDWALGTEVMAIGGDVLHIVGDGLATNGPFLNGGGFYYSAGSERPYYARFNRNTGVLLHCTNIPGHTSSHPSIAISPSGQVAIMLSTYDWGVTAGHIVNRAGAYNQATNGGFTDLYLMLLNSSYTQIWGTFLGGPGTQENGHVAFDANNNLFFSAEIQWLSGSTAATEHLVNPGGGVYYQSTNNGEDIMIGKFTSAGVLNWNTLYGGNGNDGLDDEMGNGTKVIVSPSDELIVIGGTSSTDLPLLTLSGAYNQTLPANVNSGGSYDDFASFILKFSNSGVRQWATYWGENAATSWALLYDGKFSDCNQFVLSARANYTTTPVVGYYNNATGSQCYLMQFNASTFASEWSSYVGDNTSEPQICYTSKGSKLFLTTSTWGAETTVDPSGGAFYDGVLNGSSSYMVWEFAMVPPPTLTGTATLCVGETDTWSASVSGGVWTSSNPAVASINSSSGLITALSAGTTTITYSTNVSGCPAIATALVTVTAELDAAMNAAGPFCILDAPGNLSAVNSGGTWAGTGITNAVNGTFDPATAGIGSHEITYTTSGSCPDTDTMLVTVTDVLDAAINAAGPFCVSGVSETLTAANGGGVWAGTGITDAVNGTFDPATAGIGTHEITYTTPGACADTDTIQIVVTDQLDATITSAGPFCDNEGVATLTAANPGGTWTGSGITNSTAGTFDPAMAGAGSHWVVYTISGACGDTDSASVEVFDSPSLSYVSVDESCTGAGDGSIVITVSGGTAPFDYVWNVSGTGNSLGSLSEGTFTVTVTDDRGCEALQSVTLDDPAIPCGDIIPHAVVPNAFSPNADGENDVLFVRGEGVEMLTLKIYDRWGELVFETHDLTMGWDGTFRGKALDAAVFNYILEVSFIDGSSKSEKGNITLVK